MVTAERASETELAALRAENRALRQQVEDARRESQTREQREAHFQLADRIVSTVRNLVLVANERVEVTFASPSVYRLLGYTPEEVLGEGWLNLTRKDPEERQRVKHYLSAAARGEVEISATPYERQMYDKQDRKSVV